MIAHVISFDKGFLVVLPCRIPHRGSSCGYLTPSKLRYSSKACRSLHISKVPRWCHRGSNEFEIIICLYPTDGQGLNLLATPGHQGCHSHSMHVPPDGGREHHHLQCVGRACSSGTECASTAPIVVLVI